MKGLVFFAAGALAGGVLGRAHMRERQRATEDLDAGLDYAWIEAEAHMDARALERAVPRRCRACRHIVFADPAMDAPVCEGSEDYPHPPRTMKRVS
jgi:hypothetical protein